MRTSGAQSGRPAWRAGSLVLTLLLTGGRLGADTLAEVRAAAEAGEYQRGLALARAEPDPLASLQAQVWLRYRARDFDEALAAAEQALQLAPADLWLSERATASALWLGDSRATQRTLERFSANLQAAGPADAQAFRPAWEDARQRAANLVQAEARAQAARSRARATALALLAAMCVALAWLGLSLRSRSAD